jgi:excisionase family DNA binding protein
MASSTNMDRRESLAGAGFMEVMEAAEFLSLSRSKIYELMDAEELAFARFGRARRISRQSLLEYAQRQLAAS